MMLVVQPIIKRQVVAFPKLQFFCFERIYIYFESDVPPSSVQSYTFIMKNWKILNNSNLSSSSNLLPRSFSNLLSLTILKISRVLWISSSLMSMLSFSTGRSFVEKCNLRPECTDFFTFSLCPSNHIPVGHVPNRTKYLAVSQTSQFSLTEANLFLAALGANIV